jgi:two-component system phosphate regulon sensor histidine kinase PhoR
VDARTGQRRSDAPIAGDPAPPRSRWWRRQHGAAGWISAVYAALGFAWIAFSDRMANALSADPAIRERIQTGKGSLFVLVTAALLFGLIRRSERGIRALGAEVRATVDSMADGVLLVDAGARIVEANRAAIALLGASSKQEILGPLDAWVRRFEVRSPEGPRVPADGHAMVRVLAGEPVAESGVRVRRADGRDVFVSITASRVSRAGRSPLVVAVLRDVSAARRLDDMREEFLATAAHEFKTPLAVIKAYAQLMGRREPAEQPALAVIQRQVDRLSRIVQHLLDSSRLRVEGGTGRPERFDLAALAREVVERMRPLAPSHPMAVDADAPVAVVADRDRIERVLTSLLDNAVRFSPGGGPVRARVAVTGGEARVSIADEGVGIPLERQAQIFERYYRAHAGTPHDPGGLGLGLEMSREIVEREGGRIWFESSPGAGSTFHFGLPLPREGA